MHHVELYKRRGNITSLFDNIYFSKWIGDLGESMVHLFFVLSGFLITYLLFLEQEKHGRINIKQFYLRRVFRIWPLYFIIIFLSFVIIPYVVYDSSFFNNSTYYYRLINSSDYAQAFPFYLLFLSNLALSKGMVIVGASQSWSVSVEEQFYLIWPWIFSFFKKHFALFIVFFIVLRLVITSFHLSFLNLLTMLPLEHMGLGALAAYFVFYQPPLFKKVLKNPSSLYLSLLVAVSVLFFEVGLFKSIVFSFLLCAIYFNQKIIRDIKIFNFLGHISYGVYMYHPIVMYFSYELTNNYIDPTSNLIIYNLMVYSFTVVFTVVVSQISYLYIEKPILKLKNKYNRI